MSDQTLGGIDFSQYASWPKIIAPTGAVYYKVPNTGYVYDPFLSAQKGRPVLWTNPEPQVKEKEAAEAEKNALIKAQKDAMSPSGQLLPIAGGVGGTVAAAYLVDKLTTNPVTANLDKVKLLQEKINSLTALNPVTGSVASQGAAAGEAFAQGVGISPATPNVISVSRVPGAVAPAEAASLGYAPYLGLAGAGLGAYGIYNAIQADDPKQGALAGAGFGLGLGAAAPLIGLSTGPLGWTGLGLMALGGALGGGGLTSLLGHKSTKEYQKERWGELAESEDPVLAAQGQQYMQYLGSEQAKEDAKYENTFEGKKASGRLKAEDVWGGYGILKTFGSDWLSKYTEDERRQISQSLIDNDLIYTSKGDIKLKDPAKAKQIAEEIKKGIATVVPPGGKGPATVVIPPGVAPVSPPPRPGTGVTAAPPVMISNPAQQAFVQGATGINNMMPQDVGWTITTGQRPVFSPPTSQNVGVQFDRTQVDQVLAAMTPQQREMLKQSVQPTAVPAPAPVEVINTKTRSSTLSPGISKDGKRLSAQEMGKQLAKRMNKN